MGAQSASPFVRRARWLVPLGIVVAVSCRTTVPEDTTGTGGGTSTSAGGGTSTTLLGGGGMGGIATFPTTKPENVTSTGSGAGGCEAPTSLPPDAPCTPTAPECKTSDSACLAAHIWLQGEAALLRIADLTLEKPAAFKEPLAAGLLENGIWPNRPNCQLFGDGTFSWLISVDWESGTFEIGGAKPVANGEGPYAFVSETYPTLDGRTIAVGPASDSLRYEDNCSFFHTFPLYVTIPWYQGGGAAEPTLFPFRGLRISAQHSPYDPSCVGAYNAETLSPMTGCLGGLGLTPTFAQPGILEGHITLEDADRVLSPMADQSLCVFLTGDPGQGSPARCTRDPDNKIVALGDWCSATDAAADAACADAIRFEGTFAASGVSL